VEKISVNLREKKIRKLVHADGRRENLRKSARENSGKIVHADIRRLETQMIAEKNLRKSARNKSALICERRKRWVHADVRRLKAQMGAEKKRVIWFIIFVEG